MADFKNKEAGELSKIVAEKREELRALRFGVAGSGTRNVKRQEALKKDIARALTELSMKQ